MAFSQAFLDWEEATEAKGISIGEQRGISIGEQRGISIGEQRGISIGQQEHARSLVIRLLARRMGILPTELRSQVEQLSLIQLDALSEALLDFNQLANLTDWLNDLRSVFDHRQE